MKLGICTIQRNRAKWLAEWVIFHHLVGFTDFYIYLHNCSDNSRDVVKRLQNFFQIQCFELGNDINRPQIAAYNHCYQEYGHQIDWLAFIDGDEFLYSTQFKNMSFALEPFTKIKTSSLAVFWKCFGSNDHKYEPEGLIIENYNSRAPLNFPSNKHVKSIVKGGQGQFCISSGNAHLFNTVYGTHDELLRPIDKGLMSDLDPTYTNFCINHYATQSYDFYISFKKNSGAADSNPQLVRSQEWWDLYDRNEEKDYSLFYFINPIKQFLEIL